MDSWLYQLGLGQYVSAFRCAGYDDLTTVAHLNDVDLDAINHVLGEQQQQQQPAGEGPCLCILREVLKTQLHTRW